MIVPNVVLGVREPPVDTAVGAGVESGFATPHGGLAPLPPQGLPKDQEDRPSGLPWCWKLDGEGDCACHARAEGNQTVCARRR